MTVAAPAAGITAAIDAIYRQESRRILATLIRLLGDFDLAEEALQDAFAAAVAQWPRDGVPANPRAWLVSAGRFKAIDAIRKRVRHDESLAVVGEDLLAQANDDWTPELEDVVHDRLRLVFTCCHPALAAEGRVALTLREVCGLTTEEIARAFLTAPATIAQRIVRAKKKIRDAGIPYRAPSQEDLPERLPTVLQVVYLVFSEGYSASAGDSVTRADLTREAIRLGRLLVELCPDPEAAGLLALMLLQESRRASRSRPDGELVLLEDQDRSRWNRELIAEGVAIVGSVLARPGLGSYAVQAAIAAEHARAPAAADTNWGRIVSLYDLLSRIEPSPIVELNRAVAVAMRDGPEAGLARIDAILADGVLADYHLAHAARADLCRRAGRAAEALAAYERAHALALQEPERRFLKGRIDALRAVTA
ncbi:MAG TPA: RNA polymerase sigma factor [Chthonomonadaceae bacterium]|nr:RNA polymerase sigma factor [Chthonomonadaceae bacterium]